MSKYVVGIDLGTTNTVVAFAAIDPKRKSPPVPTIFEVPQLVASREIEDRPLLPSCLYAPIAGELAGDPDWVVGELAKRRGSEVTGRFVASAKSWLSHAAVDRLAPILPWGANDETTPKISPVEAGARVLRHVRAAWDTAHGDAPLAEQDVILTLPASFDEVARELTLQAAKDAGIAPTLLEEPTAAFYDAMRDAKTMRALARSGDGEEQTVLVVDVGGGTTDLSLMAVGPDPEKKRGAFAVRRVAVGRHILLGGDNMDLALAHLAEPRIATGGAAKLDPIELAQLVHGCRDAKERVLSGDVDEARVTVLGRGSRLVGGARGTTLKRDEIERVVLGGFFPDVRGEREEPARKRAAIVAFGLPYEREPAITRHVKQFLARHERTPDALLLNGGVFNAPAIVDALVAAVGAADVLPSADPDLAVAKGAVLYGFARRGIGIRVESGASRGYYVALADEKRAVCILPRGAAEGVRHEAGGRTFEIVVGKTVRFELCSSDVRDDDAGAIVSTDDEDAFDRLPPLVSHLPASGREATVPVVLGGELLPTGQLELACSEVDGQRRFRLEFQLREGGAPKPSVAPPQSLAPAPPSGTHAAASGKVAKGIEVLEHVFGKRTDASPREVKDVVRDMEKVLGNRLTWTMEICRALADRLLANPGARRRSANHERAFFMLLGFCLRPGFGDPGDPIRIEKAWPLFDGRLGFPGEAANWQQFFIAFRRMSGGLSAEMQTAIRDAMDAVIAPKDAGLKPPKRMPEGTDELLVLLASLERVPVARRTQLGEWLLERTWTDSDALIWTAIGRVGARVPLFASVNHVVPPKNVEPWIERLVRLDWKNVSSAAHAGVQLARVTGDRARDVQERLRREVEKKLVALNAREGWVRAVRELVEVGEEERVAILGEGLPIGLRLASSET